MQKRFPLVLLGNVFFIIGMVVYVKAPIAEEHAYLMEWGGSALMIASMAVNAAYLFAVYKDRKRNNN